VPEYKQACIAGLYGVKNAVRYLAYDGGDRQAIVVAADIAEYDRGSTGEPTQGAGAVALVVSENPRLLALEVGVTGSYAQDVNDFWRPLYSKEAVVDGHHSVQCYLDALTGAYQSWKAAAAEAGIEGEIVRRCYHVPYGKMAKKAHRQVMQLEGKSDADIDASYQVEVASSLRLPSQVGNIYTGSLYLGLAGLLHAQADRLAGARIGLFSYGSGCTSEFFSGVVAPGAAARIAAAQIDELLAARERISVAEYERIMALPPTAPLLPWPGHAPGDQFRFVGVSNHQRQYASG